MCVCVCVCVCVYIYVYVYNSSYAVFSFISKAVKRQGLGLPWWSRG